MYNLEHCNCSMNSLKTVHLKNIWWCVFGCLIIFKLYSILTFHLLTISHGNEEKSAPKTKSYKQASISLKEKTLHNRTLTEAGKILEYIASNLNVTYEVIKNFGLKGNLHKITFKNSGKLSIATENAIRWAIYFNDMSLPESNFFQYGKSMALKSPTFEFKHIDGGLFSLTPVSDFEGIAPGESISILLKSQSRVTRYLVLPRWYVYAEGEEPWIIKSTDREDMGFVVPFTSKNQWKRNAADMLNPFSLEKRFEHYFIVDMGAAPQRVLPTPLFAALNTDEQLDINPRKWSICYSPLTFLEEMQQLKEVWRINEVLAAEPCPSHHVIKLKQGNIDGLFDSEEAYQIEINTKMPIIEITAQGKAGAFYAAQTLFSLSEGQSEKYSFTLPTGIIRDAPRFGYRGLHIDVSRNFIQLEDLLQIIETMAMYKLNKLHLHLTDDEGWRLEIEGLPELTQIGATRRHCGKEDNCISPALGSGPYDDTSGTGYYSASDYQTILKVASANHIEVIPEIDIPGHSHAAIRAMETRYHRFMNQGKENKAKEYLLNDLEDESWVMSVQYFIRNAINPCMESTYRFVSHVIGAIKRLHEPIQPLKMIHVGSDEAAGGSWSASPVCQEFIEETDGFPKNLKQLREYFIQRVSEICKKEYNLTMGVWEDGAFEAFGTQFETPFDKSLLHNCDVTAYAWNCNWKGISSERAYKLANAGYKVVISHATHLYFDHPQEPDPEERGMAWATRYIDDKTVFDFRPDDLYGNAKFDKNGLMYSDKEQREIKFFSQPLFETQNVIGMQAQLWTELVRDVDTLHSQLFPRLIAFAERAWHKADWEQGDSDTLRHRRNKDWMEFANVVGYKELPRLLKRGIKYRIPPPGVSVINKKFHICSLYPGFKYLFREKVECGAEKEWKVCRNGDPVPDASEEYEFASSDGDRISRIVK